MFSIARKYLSVLLALSMLFAGGGMPALAVVIIPGHPDGLRPVTVISQPDPSTFSLPASLGSVKSVHSGRSDMLLFHIQDAHCNYPAQKKIAGLISFLHDEYGVESVNLEGGQGSYDLGTFSRIINPLIRQKVSDRFVRWGQVNGAEFYAINNPGAVRLWGVEEAGLYLKNLQVYRDSLSYRPEAVKIISFFDRELKKIARRIFSRELILMNIKYAQYRQGNLDFRDYLSFLISEAKGKGLDVKAYNNLYLLSRSLEKEKEIDFEKANDQREALIDQLGERASRKEYSELVEKVMLFREKRMPELSFYEYLLEEAKTARINMDDLRDLRGYIVYIALYKAADRGMVMDEMRDMEKAIKEMLYSTRKQRELDSLMRKLILLENIFNIRLTPADHAEYAVEKEVLSAGNFMSFIEDNSLPGGLVSVPPEELERLDVCREKMAGFYEYSFERDEAFVENLRLSGEVVRTGVIVTGGFHSESFLEKIRKRGISYVSITPNFVCEDDYKCPYESVLSGEPNPLERSLADIDASSIQVPSLLNKLGIEASSPEREKAFRACVSLLEGAMQRNKPFVIRMRGERYLVMDPFAGEPVADILSGRDFRHKYEDVISEEDITGGDNLTDEDVKVILAGRKRETSEEEKVAVQFIETGSITGVSPLKGVRGLEFKIDHEEVREDGQSRKDITKGLFLFVREPVEEKFFLNRDGFLEYKPDNPWKKYITPDKQEIRVRFSDRFKARVRYMEGGRNDTFSLLAIKPFDVSKALEAYAGTGLSEGQAVRGMMEGIWEKILVEAGLRNPPPEEAEEGKGETRLYEDVEEGGLGWLGMPVEELREEDEDGGEETEAKEPALFEKAIDLYRGGDIVSAMEGLRITGKFIFSNCVYVNYELPVFKKLRRAGNWFRKKVGGEKNMIIDPDDLIFELFPRDRMPEYLYLWITDPSPEAVSSLKKTAGHLKYLRGVLEKGGFLTRDKVDGVLRTILNRAGSVRYRSADKDISREQKWKLQQEICRRNALLWAAGFRGLMNELTGHWKNGKRKNVLEEVNDRILIREGLMDPPEAMGAPAEEPDEGEDPDEYLLREIGIPLDLDGRGTGQAEKPVPSYDDSVFLFKTMIQGVQDPEVLFGLKNIAAWIEYDELADMLAQIDGKDNMIMKILSNERLLKAVRESDIESRQMELYPGQDMARRQRSLNASDILNALLVSYENNRKVLEAAAEDTGAASAEKIRNEKVWAFVKNFIAQYKQYYGITADFLSAAYGEERGAGIRRTDGGAVANEIKIIRTEGMEPPLQVGDLSEGRTGPGFRITSGYGLLSVDGEPRVEERLRDKRIYVLRTPMNGPIRDIDGDQIRDKEGRPLASLLARNMNGDHIMMFDHLPEYGEIERYVEDIIHMEDAEVFNEFRPDPGLTGRDAVRLPEGLGGYVEKSFPGGARNFKVADAEVQVDQLVHTEGKGGEEGDKITEGKVMRSGVVVYDPGEGEKVFMYEGKPFFVRETSGGANARLSYMVAEGRFGVNCIILNSGQYLREAEKAAAAREDIPDGLKEEWISERIRRNKWDDMMNFLSFIGRIGRIGEEERSGAGDYRESERMLSVRLTGDAEVDSENIKKAYRRLVRAYADNRGKDEVLGGIVVALNNARETLEKKVAASGKGAAGAEMDGDNVSAGLIGRLLDADGEVIGGGFSLVPGTDGRTAVLSHEKMRNDLTLRIVRTAGEKEKELLARRIASFAEKNRNPFLSETGSGRIRAQAGGISDEFGKIREIRVIEEYQGVRAYITSDGVLYASEDVISDPIGLFHELAERAAVIPEERVERTGIPALDGKRYREVISRHTFARGCGKALRHAFAVLAGEVGPESINDMDLDELIAGLERLMRERGIRRERTARGLGAVTDSEKGLMAFNLKVRGQYLPEGSAVRGRFLLWGLQDKLDPAGNSAFTSQISLFNEGLKPGMNIHLVRASNPMVVSKIASIISTVSKRFRKNRLELEVLRYTDADSLREQIEKAYELAHNNREKYPKITVDCNTPEDLRAAERQIESSIPAEDRANMFIVLRDFISAEPSEHLPDIAKLISVGNILCDIKRRKEDFAQKRMELADAARDSMIMFRNAGMFSRAESINVDFEYMSDEQVIDFLNKLMSGNVMISVTKVDWEEIPEWYEAQKAIESSL
jgi:hypothetical protein